MTADGAIVQEHTVKGLDGLGPAGTVQPILGRSWDPPDQDVEPRFGVIMNPYTHGAVASQLFVTEPFNNTIAVINLVITGIAPNQVFGLGSVMRIGSLALNLPVDIAPAQRDTDNVNWASNTTLDQGSDFVRRQSWGQYNRAHGARRHCRRDPACRRPAWRTKQCLRARDRHLAGWRQNLCDVHQIRQ